MKESMRASPLSKSSASRCLKTARWMRANPNPNRAGGAPSLLRAYSAVTISGVFVPSGNSTSVVASLVIHQNRKIVRGKADIRVNEHQPVHAGLQKPIDADIARERGAGAV